MAMVYAHLEPCSTLTGSALISFCIAYAASSPQVSLAEKLIAAAQEFRLQAGLWVCLGSS